MSRLPIFTKTGPPPTQRSFARSISARSLRARPWLRWQQRFMAEGVAGLTRTTRPSRIAPLPAETVDRVIEFTNQAPPHQATHWTAPAMARASVARPRCAGSGPGRVCSRIGCAPSSSPTTPNSPTSSGVVGLYIDPPAHAVVLSIDEKSQTRRSTAPSRVCREKGRCATMTHDYKRHGTTTLFAALDILEGKVIGRCMQRHRHQITAFSTPSSARWRPTRRSMRCSTTTPPTSTPG